MKLLELYPRYFEFTFDKEANNNRKGHLLIN